MKTMIDFFKTMFLMPKPWVAWVVLLMAANMVGPLFFLGTIEAQVVLSFIMMGAIIQTSIFRAKGFVRLLGSGHILWVLMVPWLWTRVGGADPSSPFGYWLMGVMVLDSLSLIIDSVDVGRYFLGEKSPTLALKT